MRKSIFIAALVSLAIFAGDAWATKLTPEQVKTVCGKKFATSPDGSQGCMKSCGEGGKQSCDYRCQTKGPAKGKCSGIVIEKVTVSPGGPANPGSLPTGGGRTAPRSP